MKITIKRHHGTPAERPTVEVQAHGIDEVTGRPDSVVIGAESAAEVEITENFNGVVLVSEDGERLAVSQRDSGFEVHYWADFGSHGFDAGWYSFNAGSAHSFASRLSTEPYLGLATNRQLIEELQARWSTGSTHPDYSTMDGDKFPTEAYTSGEFTVAASPPADLGWAPSDDDKPEGPHSRACGPGVHPHGPLCSTNCPTCGGRK